MGNLPHPPGEHLYIDFAGWHAEYTDPHTRQIHRGPILVMTLGYSKYSYIEVLPTQKGEDLMDGLQRGLRFFCGAARMIVPDNMKTAVIQSDRYEPRLNRLFEDLANHYHMAVLPARPGKPKDKPQAESAVRDAYRHVFAPLRNRTFCSLQELNLHPLFLGWVIAAIIRISVGSATVAGLTTAGITAPIVASGVVDPNLMVLSIGSGSLIFSHFNDGGFWLVKEYFNMSVKDTLKSWSLMETIVAIVGLFGVLALDLII